MNSLTDIILIFVLLANFLLLGSSRLSACIRQVAAQGAILGLLPLLAPAEGPSFRLLVVAVMILALKGIVFPKLLFRSLRTADVVRESKPIIAHTSSVVLGVGILIASFWWTRRLPLPEGHSVVSPLILPIAMATLLTGLLLVISRRLALMQVVGYLVLENGIFIFGVGLAHEEPLLIEMGILLDVFVAVLVMGIAMFHISRTFDHIGVDQLTELRD